MTPAAPTASWRKVCEEYFSRLMEDLEQQVESEVESRVAVAIEATVRGAVGDAVAESQRALAEELNQAVRRLRQSASADEVYSVLLDVTGSFCEQAVVFSVHERRARAQGVRRPLVEAGEGPAAESPPPVEVSLSEAAAFTTAIDTRDPVVAMSTEAEVSAALVQLFGHHPDERVYLFPLNVHGEAAGLLYAAGRVQAPSLELLSEVAALQLQILARLQAPALPVAQALAAPAAAGAAAGSAQLDNQLVNIAGSLFQQPVHAGAAVQTVIAPQRGEWSRLSREQQQMHLAAQRFARVQVARMRLARPDAVRSGRVRRDIYGTLRVEIDTAREEFRDKFMTASPSMVDYLHLELVRSLADDDANLFGPEYPGPLA
jgi:hypothetical protein